MKTSTKKRAKGKLHEVKGKVKEKVGRVTDDRKLEAEGRREKKAGGARRRRGEVQAAEELLAGRD